MLVYVKYDCKEPYLPIAVGDNYRELARMLGIKTSSVSCCFREKRKYWEVVEIDED